MYSTVESAVEVHFCRDRRSPISVEMRECQTQLVTMSLSMLKSLKQMLSMLKIQYLWTMIVWLPKFFNTKLRGPSHGIFCWMHSFQKLCWKPWCLLLLCQNTHSTNATCALTVGYKFVNDLKNWFSLLWLWRHWTICVTGQKSLIYKNSIAGYAQLCIEKLCQYSNCFYLMAITRLFSA